MKNAKTLNTQHPAPNSPFSILNSQFHSPPPINALITDLDDTLLTRDHRMTERTTQTLRRVQARGVKVILASGRMAASMRPFVEAVGTMCPYIVNNGALIIDPKTNDALLRNEVKRSLAKEVLLWLESERLYCQIYCGDDWFYAEQSEYADSYGLSSGVSGTLVGRLSDYINEGTPKILGIGEPDRVFELMNAGNRIFAGRLSLTTSNPRLLEITAPTATKGNAVRMLADLLHLSPETTLCAGDSLNDLSMLLWSTRPVAVANAREEVKRIAWRVAGDGREDGIAKLLDEIIPEEET